MSAQNPDPDWQRVSDKLAQALLDAKGYMIANAREPIQSKVDYYNAVMEDFYHAKQQCLTPSQSPSPSS